MHLGGPIRGRSLGSHHFITRDVVPTGDIPTGAQGVTVTTTRSPGTFFLRVVGQDHWDVAATATASTSKLSTPPPGILLPIAVIDYDWLVGQSYD